MLKKLYQHLFCQPRMARRITVAAVSNIVIGMCIAFFEKVQVGTDPCTVFNLSVVQNMLHWESLGRWQLIFNGTLVAILFMLGVSFYIVVELGESPYDALCRVISNHLPKVPYAVVRICYDLLVTGVGFLLGGTVGSFTVASCIFLAR